MADPVYVVFHYTNVSGLTALSYVPLFNILTINFSWPIFNNNVIVGVLGLIRYSIINL